MRKVIALTPGERDVLFQKDKNPKGGTFQRFMVHLQKKFRTGMQDIVLDEDDLEKIPHYAFDYPSGGGWETRLKLIFERELGPNLGREMEKDQ
jgi:hypothetical protein